MDIGNYITIGIVILGFVGQAAYLKGTFGTRIQNSEEDIRDLKKNVRYKDTCEKTHKEVDRRLNRLEVTVNGL